MAAKPSPDESEGYRLREEYRRAALRYAWAVSEITRQRKTAHGEDFDKLVKYLRETRAETAAARRALKSFASERPKNIHDSLRQEHQAAVHNFRASILDLAVLVENSAADSDFNLAHRRIRAAHRACEVARDDLEHHQAEHGVLKLKVAHLP